MAVKSTFWCDSLTMMTFCSGGIGYAGSTACASGKCTYYNDYYSQVSVS